MAKSELVDVVCKVRKDEQGQKAIAVADGTMETVDGREREKWYWLPRSQIEVNGDRTVTMPRWLAEEKGPGLMAIIIRKKVRAPEPDPVVVAPPKPVAQAPAKVTPGRLLDGECRFVMSKGPNGIVSWWLMAGYMYYIHDKPIISDALFDEMGKTLASTWNQITHQHKHLITPDDLSACTLYRLKPTDYPMMCRGGASHLAKDAWGVSINISH